MEPVSSHQARAAGELYRVLAEAEDGNVFISPFSISTALAMVSAGADGSTALQLRQSLVLPEDSAALHDGYSKALMNLQDPPNVSLNIANKMYVQNSYKMLDSYTDLLKRRYLSELRSVDFGDAAGTSRLINGDVESQTNGKIKNLIDPSALDSGVRVVLINAIYFKGSWKQKFDTKRTQHGDFFVTPGYAVKTNMMHLNGRKFNCGHIQKLGCKALEMPYEGERFSMLVLLPDDKDGLTALEEKLSKSPVHHIRGTLHNQKAMIMVPKFKLETSYDLIGPLKRLGIRDLFDEKSADLSKISGARDLFVSKVIHKAFIEVNEEGAEAAAATVAVMRKKNAACHSPTLARLNLSLTIHSSSPLLTVIRASHCSRVAT